VGLIHVVIKRQFFSLYIVTYSLQTVWHLKDIRLTCITDETAPVFNDFAAPMQDLSCGPRFRFFIFSGSKLFTLV